MLNFNFDVNDKINLYEILEISEKADKNQIKKAYKKLILKYHPDKKLTSSGEKFIEIKNAYDILSDDEKKNIYDKYLLLKKNKKNFVFTELYNHINANIINLSDYKILMIIIKKKISIYDYLYNFFNNTSISNIDSLKKIITDIDITVNYTLDELWYGFYKNISYDRITREKFEEVIFPFDRKQIYENEGEKIKFNNIELIGNLTIKINITQTEIYGEQYYLLQDELYVLINSKRIIKNKFILNFLDGNKYKFNLEKLNQIENQIGKFYIKKNFGLIKNNIYSTDAVEKSTYTRGNLYFIILI